MFNLSHAEKIHFFDFYLFLLTKFKIKLRKNILYVSNP